MMQPVYTLGTANDKCNWHGVCSRGTNLGGAGKRTVLLGVCVGGHFDHLLLTLPDWGGHHGHALQSSAEPPWNVTVQVLRALFTGGSVQRGVKPAPSALRGAELVGWFGLGMR